MLLPLFSAAAAAVALAAPAACPKLADPAATTKAAQIGDETITVGQLDAEIAGDLCKARLEFAQRLRDLRAQALDAKLDARLLAAEAKKRGLPSAQALEQRMVAGLPPPNESMARQLYDQNKDRVGGRSYESLREEILMTMQNQAAQAARGKLVAELRTQSKVKVELPPIRIPVEAKGPARGPANAPVTIVVFADFQCPYCSRGAETVEAVRQKHAKDVRVVFRDYPLGFHPEARPSAVAARCAGQQGKYWEMHDKLYAHQGELGASLYPRLAKELGLNAPQFQKCLAEPQHMAAVAADAAAGDAAGVNGTPAFYINGVQLSGAQPAEAFEAIIGQELGRRGGK